MTSITFDKQNANWGTYALLYKEKEHQFPCHIPTCEVFNSDPDPLIRAKCVVLTVLTPFVSLIRCIYWLAKSIFLALAEGFRYLDGQPFSSESRQSMIEAAEDSGRAIKYGAKMTGYALSGIAFPYWGRLEYGHTEGVLNRHTDGPHRDKVYLAFCFQRIALVDKEDPKQNDRLAERLISYLDRIGEVKKAISSGSLDRIIDASMSHRASTS